MADAVTAALLRTLRLNAPDDSDGPKAAMAAALQRVMGGGSLDMIPQASFQAPAPTAPSTSGDNGVSTLAAVPGGLSPAEAWIIQHESSGRTNAQNPTSTAFGLGQLLLANRKKYLGADYATTDPNKQLAAFRAYVRDRYGDANRAMQFWRAKGWY